ncbi:cholesterol 7-desaturase, variant 2 [Balamuthia mandrillaris]
MINNKVVVPIVAVLAVGASVFFNNEESLSSQLHPTKLWNRLSSSSFSVATATALLSDLHFWKWTVLIGVALYLFLQFYDTFFVIRYYFKSFAEGEASLIKTEKWQRRKVRGSMPPPYPNGWFFVCFSRDLKPGQVRDFEYLGQQLVVYRGKDGKAAVLDAFCPHLGANLGVNGVVRDNCLECPFHGWSFNSEGKCVSIPYAEKVPESAKVKTWTTLEHNGVVMIWHHAEGVEPEWYPPEIEGITKGYYRFHGYSIHEVRAHIQEIPENGPDTAHLNVLHKPFIGEFLGLEESVLNHGWEADWSVGQGEEQHIAFLNVKEDLLVFGHKFPGLTLDVKIKQIGPGLVQLHFATPVGTAVICQSVTPLAPTLQRVTHASTFSCFLISPLFLLFVCSFVCL